MGYLVLLVLWEGDFHACFLANNGTRIGDKRNKVSAKLSQLRVVE